MGYRSGVVKLLLRLVGRGGCGRSCDHGVRVPAVHCSCFWRSIRFSSTSECRTFQLCVRTSQMQITVVDVSVNRSDKLKQFTSVVGVLVQKTAEFSQA